VADTGQGLRQDPRTTADPTRHPVEEAVMPVYAIVYNNSAATFSTFSAAASAFADLVGRFPDAQLFSVAGSHFTNITARLRLRDMAA
jgi:hypothetical protein